MASSCSFSYTYIENDWRENGIILLTPTEAPKVTSFTLTYAFSSPLLFSVYINDLPCSVSFRKIFLFADDAKLLKSISHDASVSHLQRDLDTLTNCWLSWNLHLNSSKCVAVLFTPFTSSSSSASYQVNNHPLASVVKHKDLGVTMCANLLWSEHIKLITAKAYRSFHLIRRTFSSPSPSLRLHLYLSLVRSQLCYCSQLWRPRLLKDITCLE